MIPRTIFTDFHEIFRNSAKRFIADEITPHHGDWEAEGIVPRDVWQKAGEAGFLCRRNMVAWAVIFCTPPS
jgi:acyl-CoA dehydrogenase